MKNFLLALIAVISTFICVVIFVILVGYIINLNPLLFLKVIIIGALLGLILTLTLSIKNVLDIRDRNK